MPAPNKPPMKKTSDKGKKITPAKPAKKKSSGNLQIILAVVGLLVLLGVGITLYFVLREDTNKPVPQQARTNQGAGAKAAGAEAPAEGGAPAQPDLSATIAKVNELTDKLN